MSAPIHITLTLPDHATGMPRVTACATKPLEPAVMISERVTTAKSVISKMTKACGEMTRLAEEGEDVAAQLAVVSSACDDLSKIIAQIGDAHNAASSELAMAKARAAGADTELAVIKSFMVSSI